MTQDSDRSRPPDGDASSAWSDLQGDMKAIIHLLHAWPETSANRENLRAASKVVGDFRHDLLHHFALEECDGFLDPLVAKAPERAPAVEVLRSDHQTMRQEVDRLHHDFVVASCGGRVSLDLLAGHLRDLIDAIQDHERRENALYQAVYYRDVGGLD